MYDKQARRIVNNESADIIRIFATAFKVLEACCYVLHAADPKPALGGVPCALCRRMALLLYKKPADISLFSSAGVHGEQV